MKNLMILTLLLFLTVACKSECDVVPVKDVHEMTDEEIKEEVF